MGASVIRFPAERARPAGARFNLPCRRGERQLPLDFSGAREPCSVARLRPPNAAAHALALYVEAAQLDEDPATFERAAKLYEQAIAFDPTLAAAEINLGSLLFRRGEREAAERLYRHAIHLQPHNPEGHYNLGYALLERGDTTGALTHFEIAVSQDPGFSDAHFNLAMTLEQLGERRRARSAWKRYLELEPDGPWSSVARGHL